jgi:hypothetical protein
MTPHVPWYITLIVLVTEPLIAFAVWRILSAGAPRPVRLGLGIALAGWLGLALLLAPMPPTLAGRGEFYVNPLIPIFALAAFASAAASVRWFPALRQAVASASVPALIGVQVYRVVGVLFILLLAQGQLPAHFAEPAGWGDIVAGLTALPVAIVLARRLAGARALAIAWNVYGLLDLIVAVGMGTGVLAPYLLPGVSGRLPAAAAMGVFPLMLIPTFVVPLSAILHVIALARLRRAAPAGGRLVASAAA